MKNYHRGLLLKVFILQQKFAKLVILNCVLEPALNDATLMEKVGANTPEEVIEKCLLAGEQEELFKEIVKLSGFDKKVLMKALKLQKTNKGRSRSGALFGRRFAFATGNRRTSRIFLKTKKRLYRLLGRIGESKR